jgi:hypothetical protein
MIIRPHLVDNLTDQLGRPLAKGFRICDTNVQLANDLQVWVAETHFTSLIFSLGKDLLKSLEEHRTEI